MVLAVYVLYAAINNRTLIMILQQNSTHKAVKENGKINIYSKGVNIPIGYKYPNGDTENEGFFIKGELLYSLPLENEEDLFAIFERFDEDNRCNLAEANQTLKNI